MSDIWHSFPTYAPSESAVAHHPPHQELAPHPAADSAAQHGRIDAPDRSSHRPARRVLAGRYELEGVIGQGSMGTVFRARDLQHNALCAIKMLHKRALQDEADFQRFTNEAAVIAQLFHPNIVEVREFRRDPRNGPFLVMELLHGIDLHSQLADGRKLPLDRVQLVVRQVASALHAAHSLGIIHRDIKPRNIFLSQQSGTTAALVEIVKVVDFGLSKILGSRAQTAPGEILGTPEYLAPEGTWGRSALIDERTDQWALAVTAYRMLAGTLPFRDEDVLRLMLKIRQQPLPLLSTHAVHVPEYVTQALSRALSKKKEDRYPSVLDFARALYGLSGTVAISGADSPIPLAASGSLRAESAKAPGAVVALWPRVPPLSPEQERQIEQLERTQPISQKVLDDLLCLSCTEAAPGAANLPPRGAAADGAACAIPDLCIAPAAAIGAAESGDREVRSRSTKQHLAIAGSFFFVLLSAAICVGLIRDRVLHPQILPAVSAQTQLRTSEPLAEPGAGPLSALPLLTLDPAVQSEGSPTPGASLPTAAGPSADFTERTTPSAAAPMAALNRRILPSAVRKPGPLAAGHVASALGVTDAAGPPLPEQTPAASPAPADAPASDSKELLGGPLGVSAQPASDPAPTGSAVSANSAAASRDRQSQNPAVRPAPAPPPRRPQRLAGVDPQLPVWVRSVLGRDPVSGNYLICIGVSGAVERVSILASIPPADDVITEALRSWRYAPRSAPLCFEQEFHFMLDS